MRADTLSMDALGRFANLGATELARRTFTAERTARRWISTGLVPRLALEFLRLIFDGPLGLISQPWNGWSLRRGKLRSPDGDEFTPEEVRALPLQLQRVRSLECELRSIADSRQADASPIGDKSDHRAEREPDPSGQLTTRGRGDFLDHVTAVSRDHGSPPCAEAPVFAPGGQPTLSFSCHVSCPSCEQPFSLTLAPATSQHPPLSADARSPSPLPAAQSSRGRAARLAPSRAVPAPVYASDP